MLCFCHGKSILYCLLWILVTAVCQYLVLKYLWDEVWIWVGEVLETFQRFCFVSSPVNCLKACYSFFPILRGMHLFFVQILLVLKVKPWSIRKHWLVSSLRALSWRKSPNAKVVGLTKEGKVSAIPLYITSLLRWARWAQLWHQRQYWLQKADSALKYFPSYGTCRKAHDQSACFRLSSRQDFCFLSGWILFLICVGHHTAKFIERQKILLLDTYTFSNFFKLT